MWDYKRHSIFKFIILAIVFFLLFGWIVMSLWNWLMPEIFGLTTITILQAYGLLALSKILFGGWGNGDRSKKKEHKGWKKRWDSKWKNMSEEEKVAWKAKMKDRAWWKNWDQDFQDKC